MTTTKAIIRISAITDAKIKAVLAGVAEDVKRTGRAALSEEQKNAKASAAAKIKAAKDGEKAVEQAAKQEAKTAEQLAKEEGRWVEYVEKLKYQSVQNSLRAAERAAALTRRESEKTARAQIKDAERAWREVSSYRRRMAVGAAGGLLGAGAAALGRVRSYQGAYGVQSQEALATKAVDFQRRSIVVADMASLNPDEQSEMKKKVLATSARTGVDASDLLGGLETAQDRFSDLKGFAAILDQLADISVATGTDVNAVVGAMGVMRRQFGLTDEEMTHLGGAMVRAADLGNISFQELATNFTGALGELGRNAHLHGEKGAIQALAIAQTLGSSDMNPAEAATLGIRTVSALNDTEVQHKLHRAFKVDVAKDGVMQDMPTILRQLADKGFMDPKNAALRQVIFPDERGQRGIEVLVNAFKEHPEETTALLNVKPNEGRDAIARRIEAMSAGPEGQAATMGARQFAQFMSSGELERFLEITVKSADGLTKLEGEYPLLTEATKIATDALKAMGATWFGLKLLGRAGGSTGGAAAMGGAGAEVGGAVVAGGGTALAVGAAPAATAAALLTFFGSDTITKDFLAVTGLNTKLLELGATIREVVPESALPHPSSAQSGEHPFALLRYPGLSAPPAHDPKPIQVETSTELHVSVTDDRVRVSPVNSSGPVETYVETGRSFPY